MTVSTATISARRRQAVTQRPFPNGQLAVHGFSPNVRFVRLRPSHAKCARFQPNHPTMSVLCEMSFRQASSPFLPSSIFRPTAKRRVCSVRQKIGGVNDKGSNRETLEKACLNDPDSDPKNENIATSAAKESPAEGGARGSGDPTTRYRSVGSNINSTGTPAGRAALEERE